MNADLGFFRHDKTLLEDSATVAAARLRVNFEESTARQGICSLSQSANPSATVFELQSVSPGQVWTTSACLVPTMAQWVGGNHSGHVRGVFFSGTCLRLRPHSCLPKQLRSRRNPKDLQRQGFLNPPEF